MVDKLYHRANPHSSFRPITRFVVEMQRFVCNRATPPIIEKLWSKDLTMHAYGVSAHYANDSRLFLDAQEAKKVSKRTVVR